MEKTSAADLAHWAMVLARSHGITARLEPIYGSIDLSLRVLSHDGPNHVLKVMGADAEPELFDLQCAALEHLKRRPLAVSVPQVVPSLEGHRITLCLDRQDCLRRLMLITLIDGVPWGASSLHPPELVRELGRRIAKLDLALADFAHPALERCHDWNLARAAWIRPHLDAVAAPDHRRTLTRICDAFEGHAAPALARLPRVPIHNDLNDYNILVVRDAAGEPQISGFIDFNDMVAAPIVCEVAIAGAYAVLEQDCPAETLCNLVAAYNSVHPLCDRELALIFPLLLARLAVSVVSSAMVKRLHPDDPYVVISEAPAWRFLERTDDISPEHVLALLRRACARSAA